MKPIDRIVWTDIETTGLDPEKDQILEVGVIVTDRALKEIGAESWIVKPNGIVLNPYVLAMHGKNGLLGELHNGDKLSEVDIMAAGMVHALNAAGGPIAGASPHFDKRFIDRYMPLLATCFNHRCFDTSTLKLWWCLCSGEKWEDIGPPAHRVLDDIRYSIEVAKTCSHAYRPFGEPAAEVLIDQYHPEIGRAQ